MRSGPALLQPALLLRRNCTCSACHGFAVAAPHFSHNTPCLWLTHSLHPIPSCSARPRTTAAVQSAPVWTVWTKRRPESSTSAHRARSQRAPARCQSRPRRPKSPPPRRSHPPRCQSRSPLRRPPKSPPPRLSRQPPRRPSHPPRCQSRSPLRRPPSRCHSLSRPLDRQGVAPATKCAHIPTEGRYPAASCHLDPATRPPPRNYTPLLTSMGE